MVNIFFIDHCFQNHFKFTIILRLLTELIYLKLIIVVQLIFNTFHLTKILIVFIY